MSLQNWILLLVHAVIAPAMAAHALLYKRDPRAALGWTALCLLFPLVGPFLYFVFGINRIRSRAHRLAGRPPFSVRVGFERGARGPASLPPSARPAPEFEPLARIGARVASLPLIAGNRLDVLHNGEAAYPAMLAAIDAAEKRILLSSYIFENDDTGRQFVERLAAAGQRGVAVRVLIDGVGELYSWPRISAALRRRDIPVARFLPLRLLPPQLHLNLRNHRKILTVDGRTGFTGGMNIGSRHLVEEPRRRRPVRDVHFRIEGAVVAQLEDVFIRDWASATGERLPSLPATAVETGAAMCRIISDGPDEDLDKLAILIEGVVSAASAQIQIMTPYFLPSRELVAVLNAAALRGVQIDIILPEKNNLPFVHWATRNMLWELLQNDIRVWYQPPPFTHSKLLLVDRKYALLGSANLDPRSLRLNFELGLEVFDAPFASRLAEQVGAVCESSRAVTLEEVDGRAIPERLRDALCWLFSPYL